MLNLKFTEHVDLKFNETGSWTGGSLNRLFAGTLICKIIDLSFIHPSFIFVNILSQFKTE